MFQDYPDILTPVQASKALRIGTKTFYSLIREKIGAYPHRQEDLGSQALPCGFCKK